MWYTYGMSVRPKSYGRFLTRTRRDGSTVTFPYGYRRRNRSIPTHTPPREPAIVRNGFLSGRGIHAWCSKHRPPFWQLVLAVLVLQFICELILAIHPQDPHRPSHWDHHSLPGQTYIQQ